MRTHRIAAIGGDGIGPEVIEAGLQALAVCAERDGGFALEVTHFDWGSDFYARHGAMMPSDGVERLRSFDATHYVPQFCGTGNSEMAPRMSRYPADYPTLGFASLSP
jgi:isocitrate/isopropylmalate dehydrogenase